MVDFTEKAGNGGRLDRRDCGIAGGRLSLSPDIPSREKRGL